MSIAKKANHSATQNKATTPETSAITSPVRKPTAAELALLRVLWQQGPATAKQVFERVQADRPEINQATVLRQLQIMHADNLLTRDESARSHVYAAAQPQEKLQTNLLKDFIQRAFSGSGKELIMAALKEHVSDKDRAEIQAFLHEDKNGDNK
ncbi:BlaI/MecI/CopY family transcriptional regulator [Undibacterium baiyunense]|uniref:BlaI/MecI/CopY family transcriptional regulator n=1 Tax=Undibacterium baiyunense TaxID=2828731 RepID=A0A941DBY3_9BURK|nr:BlaI/MecI/CopY family transcriptional regulator [Undibacterium baiyunense]MBR7745869.1 BlaI/MecI/CopY family transcriptional regulator [Undibacterium baiyunense]